MVSALGLFFKILADDVEDEDGTEDEDNDVDEDDDDILSTLFHNECIFLALVSI